MSPLVIYFVTPRKAAGRSNLAALTILDARGRSPDGTTRGHLLRRLLIIRSMFARRLPEIIVFVDATSSSNAEKSGVGKPNEEI